MDNIMTFLHDYWQFIIATLAMVAVIMLWIKSFVQLPTDKKIDNIREWLLYAVTKAEKELGGGTGQIKLRMVYDMFITNFADISKWISFDTFSALVDETLDKFRNMLDTNEKLNEYVYGNNNESEVNGDDKAGSNK